MPSKYRPDEIQQLAREEKNRNRTPWDREKVENLKDLKRDLKHRLDSMTWKEIEMAIAVIGAVPGTPEYDEFRLIWREYQQGKRRQEPP